MSELDFEVITEELNYSREITKEAENFDPDDPKIQWKYPAKSILVILVCEGGKRTLKLVASEGTGRVAHFTSEGE